MGITFQEQDKLEEAIEAYNKAITTADFAEAFNNMGNALKEQGKLEKAIEAFDKVGDQTAIAKALECNYFWEIMIINKRLESLSKMILLIFELLQ